MPVTWVPDPPRVFNLGLRARQIAPDGKTITLQVASDEALLIDYAPLATDLGAIPVRGSLRGIVNYVLGKIGAVLAPGTDDADMTTYTDAKNMIRDPGTAGTVGGGYSVTNCSYDNNDTSWAGISGDGDCFNLYNPTAADSFLSVGAVSGTLDFGIQAGRTYVFSATGRVKVAVGGTVDPRARRLFVLWKRQGESVVTTATSPPLPTTVGAVTRLSVEFTVPDGAAEVTLRAYLGHTVGQVQWDGFRLSEKNPSPGVDDVEYFDGDTPDTAEYRYDWAGAPDGSASTRKALIDRPPEILVWKPGVYAWDFLAPLTSSVGLKLFCDELRVWRLVNPAEYVVPGFLSLAGFNTVDGLDTISREDPEVFATGIVVEYLWEDSAGVAQIAYDTAGTPEKVVTITYRRPYPGPGAAAAILARRNGTGRTQDVTALGQWSATPGMQASITTPGIGQVQGKVASVQFSLGDDALMDVGTRGLIDIHDGSIDALVGTIDALVGTIDSL